MSDKARAHIFVSGRVQGVGFRWSVLNKARQFGIKGWVRNLPDGRVEAVFEGNKEIVEKIISWTKEGPYFAKVEKVDVQWENYTGEFEDFTVITS